MPTCRADRRERMAGLYDRVMLPADLVLRRIRARMLADVTGDVLEVGVGTGLNLRHYRDGVNLTAIDISPTMLNQARKRAAELGMSVNFFEMDLERIALPPASFDFVIGTLVFCEVESPVRGLKELARVVRPSGRILLLEHMRSERRWLGKMMDLLNPLALSLIGDNINRRTLDLVWESGLEVIQVRREASEVLKSIVATPPSRM
ncbi:MAG: class I SAM-dependent methyltransferase [Candidatus Geothermincolia bacterium]